MLCDCTILALITRSLCQTKYSFFYFKFWKTPNILEQTKSDNDLSTKFPSNNKNSPRLNIFAFFFLQESEIVEVLWKQDVDLGYTLAPAKAASSKEATVNSSGTVLNTDETEKLKALRDLKEEKVCNFDLFLTKKVKKNTQFHLSLVCCWLMLIWWYSGIGKRRFPEKRTQRWMGWYPIYCWQWNW